MEKLRQMPSKGESDLTLLQDEAPLYGSGVCPMGGTLIQGPIPQNWGHPCRLLPAPGCFHLPGGHPHLWGIGGSAVPTCRHDFPHLRGMVRHLCRWFSYGGMKTVRT